MGLLKRLYRISRFMTKRQGGVLLPETTFVVLRARSQGSNPWQTQGMALDVSLLAHFPLDPIASLRYKTSISLTLL
jgi:hypothetical protein